MLIRTNVATIKAQRHLKTSFLTMKTSMESLASGKHIISAMDDSAGFAIAHFLEPKISLKNEGVQNGNDGI